MYKDNEDQSGKTKMREGCLPDVKVSFEAIFELVIEALVIITAW